MWTIYESPITARPMAAVIAATQYLKNGIDELADSVLGNVGTMLCFRSNPDDSRKLAARIRPFELEHLEQLDRFEAIASLQVHGQTLPAMDIRTLPIPGEPRPRALAVDQDPDSPEARLRHIRGMQQPASHSPRAETEPAAHAGRIGGGSTSMRSETEAVSSGCGSAATAGCYRS